MPLHLACSLPLSLSLPRAIIVDLLIKHILNDNAFVSGEFAITALHLAAKTGNTPVMQALLNAGTDKKDKEGYERSTPLEVTIDKGEEDVIGVFLE